MKLFWLNKKDFKTGITFASRMQIDQDDGVPSCSALFKGVRSAEEFSSFFPLHTAAPMEPVRGVILAYYWSIVSHAAVLERRVFVGSFCSFVCVCVCV